MKKKLVYLLVFLYVCFSLVLPAFFMNKIIFAIIFILNIIVVFSVNLKVKSLSPFFVLSVFLYSFFLSFNFEYSSNLRLQLLLVTSTLFSIYILDYYSLDMNKIVVGSSLVLAVSTYILIYSVKYSNIAVYSVFLEYGQIGTGYRDVGRGVREFYRIGSVPFLFIGFSIILRRLSINVNLFDFVSLLFIISCVFFSSTRALLVGFVLITVFVFFRKNLAMTLLLLFIGVIYSFIGSSFIGDIFDIKDAGNSVKIGHIISFFDWAQPVNLLFGEGLASYYYSEGNNRLVPQTEITLLDNIRYFGIPFTLIFYFLILWPVMKQAPWRIDNGFPFAVMSIYLLMSLTNPMLVNSFGFIVILWYWTNILRYSK